MGFIDLIVGAVGAVSSLFTGQTVPIAPAVVPPKPPWYKTPAGMVVIGVGGLTVVGLAYYGLSGPKGGGSVSGYSKRRRRRRR
jgi:hypothetical protein